MTENCLPSQMTCFNANFSLFKVKVEIPYQKIIVDVNHFSLIKKCIFDMKSVSVCNGHPPIQAAHPSLIWCAVTQNQALTTL